jgi:peptide/nickel transport system substrate-binding protein
LTAGVGAATVASLLSAGLITGAGATTSRANAQSISVALDETVSGFNVLTSADNNFDLNQMMELVWPSAFITTNQLNVVPNSQLLTSVTQTKASPQTIVFRINPKAVWRDGVPITAADFIYNWKAQSGIASFTDKGGKPFDDAATAGYNQIKTIASSDGGKTATVVFATPFADWKSLFITMVPAHIATKVGWNTGFDNWKNAISGAWYSITSYKPGAFLVLTRNPKYWSTPGLLPKITFTWVATDDSEPTGLQNGELQVINPASVTQSLVAQANAVKNTKHRTIAGLEFEHLDFNQANPYLALLPVRQAIAYGTNRAQIIADTVGSILPSTKPLGNRILMPNQPGYVNNGKAYAKVNVAKAMALLSGLGYRQVGGYFQPTTGPEAGQPLTFTIMSTTGNPIRSETEQLFQAQMAQIGIKINIQNYPGQTFGGNLQGGQFDIVEFAWVATPFASGFQSVYCSYNLGSQCGSNFNHYANAAVTALIQAGSSATKPKAEMADYNKADALMWKDMATLPLYQKPQYFAWSTKYGAIVPNPSMSGITWNANLWAAKAS